MPRRLSEDLREYKAFLKLLVRLGGMSRGSALLAYHRLKKKLKGRREVSLQKTTPAPPPQVEHYDLGWLLTQDSQDRIAAYYYYLNLYLGSWQKAADYLGMKRTALDKAFRRRRDPSYGQSKET